MKTADLTEVLGDWAVGQGPLYRKLALALYRRARDGMLEPDTMLPSERALAVGLGVSRATVSAAYDELRGMGVIDRRQGSGTRVGRVTSNDRTVDGRAAHGRASSVLQRMVEEPGGVISLANAADVPPSELAYELERVVREDLGALTADTGYQPRGLPALRSAVAEHFTAIGLPTEPRQVLVTTGASQALALIAGMYLRPGALVAVESPGWPGCFDVFQARGARLATVAMDEAGIEIGSLQELMKEHAPDLLYVMPAHNPTGTVMTPSRRRQVARVAAAHGVPIVEDLAYDDSSELTPVAAYGTGEILTVGSLAKAVWPGLRIGWVRAAPELIDRLARLKALADLASPILDQAVAARLVPQLSAISQVNRTRTQEQLARLSDLLADRCPTWTWRSPDCGTALWIELPGVDARVFAQVALRHGVEVVPGAAADASGGHESYIRVPFTFPEPVLCELADRLAAAWDAMA